MLRLWLTGLVTAIALPCAAFAQAEYQPPRTAQGHPDFQGNWTAAWLTPLERPPQVTSLVLGPNDASALLDVLWKRLDATDPLSPLESIDVRSLAMVGGNARSSLIVDPPDGQLPLTETARARRNQPPPASGLDGPEQRPPSERCSVKTNLVAPLLVLPAGNIRQIVQTADHLVILSETYGLARIIPTHEQARATPASGRGRWEGDTFVVESSGFAPADRVRAGPYANFPISPATRIMERFTRTSDDEILYSFAVEDAGLYTRPWRAEMALARSADRVFEWACHEGNYAMTNMLRGARIVP